MSNLLIENKKLMSEWNYKKNAEFDLNNITSGSSKKVWWKCNKGHEWKAVIHTRTKGVGCPYCAGKKAIKGTNDFETLHPEMLKEWNYEENDKSNYFPDEMLVGSLKLVNWVCPNGHKYQRSIYDRLNGRGHCPYCTNRKVLKGYNDLAPTNPELLKEWNYEKNDAIGIKPDEITNGGKNKVWWKCDKGHEWSSIIRSRITGSGCPYCSNNLVLKGYNDLATTNPEVLNDWNYEKNINITPFEISHGSTKKVWWKCNKGHEYNISPAQKIRGKIVCPICSNQQVLKGYNDFATRHPKLLEEWNYEKNDKLGLRPDEIIAAKRIKAWWKCNKGHEWQSAINDRIRNNKLYNRCPICSSYLRTSIPEKIIYYYLKKVYSGTIANYKPEWLKPKELDVYIPEINVGIEYDGYYYHKDYKRDLDKDSLCSKNNVKLIRIREKKSKPINSDAIIYVMDKDNNADYSYVEDALSFLNQYLKLNIDYNISRDIDDILSMINFIEKENCIAKTNPEVLNGWDYEKNNEIGLTPENTSNGSSLKTWWKCENGHSYKATLSTKISQNTGCPYCSKKTLLEGFNDLATMNPELLNEWDYDSNNKINVSPNVLFPNSSKKVYWKCNNGHLYIASPNSRISGSGCPYCSGHKVLIGYNDIKTTNPELIEEWDYEKNGELGYEMENYSKGNATKVWWKCSNGHSYQTSINSKTSPKKAGCPYCSGQKLLKGYNDFATTNPELLSEWDYKKNIVNPDELTSGTHTKIWWICDKGHSYQATIPNRRRGTNCPYCSGNKVLVGFNDLATTHPEVLSQWDYEKNKEIGITPNNISKSYSKKVWWKCDKGHLYQREVYNQRNGYGKCPICKSSVR